MYSKSYDPCDDHECPSQPVGSSYLSTLCGEVQQRTKNKTAKLINNALGPDEWKMHLENNLMKFWKMPEAIEFQGDLFPTYRTNSGELLPKNKECWPIEFVEALKDPVTAGLVQPDFNFVRIHSRQTYAYGIAFHMTGKSEYLRLCRKGVLALINAMDGNFGMFTTQETDSRNWGADRKKRTSQDLAYGLTGMGMYYFLTHDQGVLHRIIQVKDYIFKHYFDEGRGYLTWYPKYTKDPDVEIVAQLDQLYAYMLGLTPALPEPYKTEWMKDLKKVTDVMIRKFYSERYHFFWGVESVPTNMTLGTEHTDFGHSVKAFWVILKIGDLLGETFYIDFARPHIEKILNDAYIKETGSWARRFDENGNLDTDKEWWILAELDQACAILALNDPSYLEYLNNTQRYWLDKMVDHKHGEIWHMVSGKDNKPVINYPKSHNWKNGEHSFEHALFSYITSSSIKNMDLNLYYALPEWERVSHRIVQPYMFRGNVIGIMNSNEKLPFMPDNNRINCVTYNSIH